ncbi:putative DNA binding domain-containing protein [Desulfococcaceae bacterium HSG9]|nr:putative DNA binding domain-containing protein [Desulfococcaceae bacterium HSG9]
MNKMDKSTKINIVAEFANEVKILAKSKRCLRLAISNFSVFDIEDSNFDIASGLSWVNEISHDAKYDLILGDLPLGMNRINFEFGDNKLKIRRNWVELLNALKFLKINGVAIFLVEPTVFSLNDGVEIENALNSEGYFVNAIFNAPQGILQPETSITPVFILISSKQTDSIFIAELYNENQSREVAKNYFSNVDSGDLKHGMEIPQKSYQGFHRIKIKQQIEKLETQYKEYEEYTIGRLAIEINYVKSGEKLKEKGNSIYIPKIGNSPVISKITDANIKHHNYFQVVLGEKSINEYVSAFFRSDLGRLILESLTSGLFIPHLNKRDLEQATVALPAFKEQKQILSTQKKLNDLKQAIDVFDSELALNPNSSSSIVGQLDSMLEAIGGLTDIDRIHNIIRQGESKYIEFKETLNLDVRKKTKEKYIVLAVLKTVVAFLNTEGGILLVGVNDNKDITGIESEIKKFHKNTDKFLLHFKNLIKTRIGEGFYPFIEYKPIKVDGKCILMVECKGSPSPCYLDNADFYVRTNPATDKLEGPKLVEYVNNHFNL